MERAMIVTFVRTGVRRYAVRVTREGFAPVEMSPAPGYDDLLPHDLVHFVVEEELGLALGIFGQLAAGGTAGTFRLGAATSSPRERARTQRKSKRRGERLGRLGSRDAELSERAAAICHHRWLVRSTSPKHRREARSMAPYCRRLWEACSDVERRMLSEATVERICSRLDRLSAAWSRLGVGEPLELRWAPVAGVPSKRKDAAADRS